MDSQQHIVERIDLAGSTRGLNARLLSAADDVVCSFSTSDRRISKAELMGRLCYCGFSIDGVDETSDTITLSAHRVSDPVDGGRERHYGCVIALPRVGYHGRIVKMYKFRTMAPYSEFLQQWMYDNHHLTRGGKFANDFRITRLGKTLRRWSLDEIPMIFNMLRGDIKLVGVRPLSRQYFNLYSAELQQLRIQFKPGLFPPYYADMPCGFDDIERSEMRYLHRCQRHGIFKTDFHYFWQIAVNIIFKGKRNG